MGIMVGVSLLGILTLGMMQVFSSMMRNQNYNKFRTQVENFGEEIRTLLGTKALCTANFSGTVLDAHTAKNVVAIKDTSGNIIYKSGVDYGDHSFTIVSMDFKSTPTSPWYIEDNTATGTGRAILTVNYRASTEQAGPKDYFRTYTLQTHRDATNKLIDCAAMAKMSDGIWRYNSTTLADIYYSGGNVGIGTTNPAAILEVDGASGTTLKIVDGNQAAGKVLTSDANGQASWKVAGGGSGLNGIQRFTTSGTWTVPDGVTKVKVTAIGGGGGGHGGSTYICCGPYSSYTGGTAGTSSSLQGCSVQGGGGGGAVAGVYMNQTPRATHGTAVGSITYTGDDPNIGEIPNAIGFGIGGAGIGGWGSPGGNGGVGIGVCDITPGATLALTVGAAGTSASGSGTPGIVLLEW